MWDHKINNVEISDDDEDFMEINLPVDNLVHMDSEDDELFTNYPTSGVKGLNGRGAKGFVPNFSFGIDWINDDGCDDENDKKLRFSQISDQAEITNGFVNHIPKNTLEQPCCC